MLAGSRSPVQAKIQATPMRGSYFGALQSTNGDVWPSDFTIYTQKGRNFGGTLSITGRVQGALFTGTCAAESFNLTSHATPGQPNVRIRLKGTIQTEPNSNDVLVQGTYVIRGAFVDKGNFNFEGALVQ
jgi:hypothetical protein